MLHFITVWPINRVVSAEGQLPHPVRQRHAPMGANFPFRPQSSMHSAPPAAAADSQPGALTDTPWQVSALNHSPILKETPSVDL